MKPAPAPQTMYPGRNKPVEMWNAWRMNKLLDELTRTFYYTFRGYEGPHPWGVGARPPYPEVNLLKVRDPVGGASYRTIIEKHLQSPRVRTRMYRTLMELRTLLRGVDHQNPRLKNKVKVKTTPKGKVPGA